MQQIVYLNYSDINELQQDIMHFVSWWVHNQKTPIPLKEIICKMKNNTVKDFTTINAINSLLKKGYIRRAVTSSNKTYFVQLRNL